MFPLFQKPFYKNPLEFPVIIFLVLIYHKYTVKESLKLDRVYFHKHNLQYVELFPLSLKYSDLLRVMVLKVALLKALALGASMTSFLFALFSITGIINLVFLFVRKMIVAADFFSIAFTSCFLVLTTISPDAALAGKTPTIKTRASVTAINFVKRDQSLCDFLSLIACPPVKILVLYALHHFQKRIGVVYHLVIS